MPADLRDVAPRSLSERVFLRRVARLLRLHPDAPLRRVLDEIDRRVAERQAAGHADVARLRVQSVAELMGQLKVIETLLRPAPATAKQALAGRVRAGAAPAVALPEPLQAIRTARLDG